MKSYFGILSLSAIGFLVLTGSPTSVSADGSNLHSLTRSEGDHDHDHPCPTPTPTHCPEQKQAHFNVQCVFYEDHRDAEYKNCKVAAEFEKMVTLDGGEVTDDSKYPFNPQFEIQCDGKWIQKDHSRRYTEILGTRIQAEQGPYPALVLPRGVLSEGPHSTDARLELDGRTVEGSCFIYTGPSL